MANETNEKDIFFGKPGQERELTDPVPAPPKPAPAPKTVAPKPKVEKWR